jgi:hypothetical protein
MLMRKPEQRRPHLLLASKQRTTLSAAYLTIFLVEKKLEQYDFQHFTVLQCRRAATLDCRTVYSVLSDCTIHRSTPK